MLPSVEERFIEFALAQGVLRFGTFTLKSGRISPYFFNAGLFNSGPALSLVGQFYAEVIVGSDIGFDMLFGPAYKGIPLVAATAIALADRHRRDAPYAFNRKEEKGHGEGGSLIGAPLKGRVLIIDDVITAGSAIREVIPIILQSEAVITGVVIMVDREERGSGEHSALSEIQDEYGIPVLSIVKLRDLVDYLARRQMDPELLRRVMAYRAEYGVGSSSSEEASKPETGMDEIR